MTIASEITRLQWAKTDIKSSIEWKWVSVPSNAKLDTYDTYIDQIRTWMWWLEVFLPESIAVLDTIRNTNADPWIRDYIFDTISADESTYYQYFWYRDDTSTANRSFKVWILYKSPTTNPWFTQWLTVETEWNNDSITRVVSKRMKKSWNDVICSVLYTMEHDSSRQTPSWRTKRYSCVNMTNNTWTAVTLWTISGDSWWQYSDEDVQRMYQLREESCGLTSSDVLPSSNLTTLSFRQTATGSSTFDLIATINYPS